jgi:hypothetical protein
VGRGTLRILAALSAIAFPSPGRKQTVILSKGCPAKLREPLSQPDGSTSRSEAPDANVGEGSRRLATELIA